MERVKEIFGSLGDIRDGILVGASALYLLGYFGWAVFAWGFQLGVAPAFQAQYFVAGLPLLVVVALATAAAVLLRRLLIQRWPDWFGKRNRSTKLILVISVALVTLLAALLQYAFPDYNFTLTRRPLWFTFAVTMVFLFGLLLLATPLGAEGVEGVGYTLLLYASVAILAVVPYTYLALFLYPRVPQFFGGGKPRCAHLDLYAERFSPETLSELVADPATAGEVARSKEVGLIFSSGEAVYVFVPRAPQEFKRYEIKRGDVSAIEWCEAFTDAANP